MSSTLFSRSTCLSLLSLSLPLTLSPTEFLFSCVCVLHHRFHPHPSYYLVLLVSSATLIAIMSRKRSRNYWDLSLLQVWLLTMPSPDRSASEKTTPTGDSSQLPNEPVPAKQSGSGTSKHSLSGKAHNDLGTFSPYESKIPRLTTVHSNEEYR